VTDEVAASRGGVSAFRRGAAVVRAVLLGSPPAIGGAAILGVHVVSPYDYAQFNILHTLEAPSREFLGGTDQYGRDHDRRLGP
jgi:hypothetical protein